MGNFKQRCGIISFVLYLDVAVRISSVSKDVEHLELSHTAGGKIKWNNYFGKQFASFFKSYLLIYHMTQHSLLGFNPREMKACLDSNLSMDVNNIFIHNCPKLKTIQMSISRWMTKKNVVYSFNIILPSNEKEKNYWYPQQIWINLINNYTEWKNPG